MNNYPEKYQILSKGINLDTANVDDIIDILKAIEERHI